ncbi:MAG: diguanylate cyclase [Burkholderiales bacterium]|jgi:diguanylate cyclase (GGDEF)-like protein|nr:diguanylate cyclase [Burkholderiales bacterium]
MNAPGLDHKTFDDFKTTGKLPSPSGVALRIVELTRKDDVSLPELARVVQADPALSGRLVKFSNSALAGSRRPIVAVVDAIRLLGIGTVRQLALGFSVLAGSRKGTARRFDHDRFWSCSLATGIAANALCLRTRTAQGDEAFTCGLLAGIGRLALATLYPEQYDGEAGVDMAPAALRAQERERFGADHAELCSAMLEDWMLPRLFVNAVYHHEDPAGGHLLDGSREATLTWLLHLASRIGEWCIVDDVLRRPMLGDLVFLAAKIGVDAETIAEVCDQVVVEWRDWGRLLEVRTQDVPAFAEITRIVEQAAAAAAPVTAAVAASAPSPERVALDPLPGGTSALRVLVADDESAGRTQLGQLLTAEDYQVTLASDGQQALQLAIRERPHIIVADWLMPEMDGLNLCRALRETAEGRHIYFVLLSDHAKDDSVVAAFEAGVDDFVAKPFSPKVIVARLKAGQRVVRLEEEAAQDARNLRRFATEYAVANRRLRQAALTDSLTGLPNRRYAMERLEQDWAAATRNQRALTVMMIDVDRFKTVNDTYGHEAGDVVLRQVAGALRKAARTEDVICRIGGEEFLVISPDTGLQPGVKVAERFRAAVEALAFSAASVRYTITVSIGVAERGPSQARQDALVKAADEALYRAKRAGGNRVEAAIPA